MELNTKFPKFYYNLCIIFFFSISILSGQENSDQEFLGKNIISLNSVNTGDWMLQYGMQDKNAPASLEELNSSEWEKINAWVPGNVELDLWNAGKIKDPMIGNNVYDLRQYETFQWWYSRKFKKPEIPEGHRVELRFEGIDCIADIWLNGEKIAHVENMFVEHQFDVTDLLREENELYIKIYSAVLEGRKYKREAFGIKYDALGGESVNIRKAAHSYGWDILPRLVSAGLWKDVSLEVIPPTHFKSVYWVTKSVDVQQKTAAMYVDWDFATDRLNVDDLVLNVKLRRNGEVVYADSMQLYTTVSRYRIWGLKNVEFWWPRGYGNPALYEAILQITDKNGEVIAEDVQKIGIRKAELLRSEANTKENPGEFVFIVNGEKIFVKGTNWVALDALHSRDKGHIQPSMDMLVDLNCNMVRMWGGNVYEQDAFYDLCDANGIMVWHDFSFACTTYPQDNDFVKRVEEEAEKILYRLRHHPSIVLWAGNNENDVALQWAWDQIHIDPNLDIISRRVLPAMVLRLDPETPYLPSSPYISPEAYRLAGESDPRFAASNGKIDQNFAPEQHLWGPRGFYKDPFYTENTAKFVSEIGYHGCPSRSSLEKMMDADYVYPWTKDFVWNDQWETKRVRSHPSSTNTQNRNDLMINQIKSVFTEVPTDLDLFITASQIIQGEAMKYFIEFWRMNKGERNGILWWNLRDGWPVISDAVVDYYYDKKLAYHYIKRVQTDVCVMIGDAKASGHPVVIVNDTRDKVEGVFSVRDADSKEVVISRNFSLAANGKSVEEFLPETEGTKLWLIEWEINGQKYTNHYFAFKPQVKLERYLNWLPELKLQTY